MLLLHLSCDCDIHKSYTARIKLLKLQIYCLVSTIARNSGNCNLIGHVVVMDIHVIMI